MAEIRAFQFPSFIWPQPAEVDQPVDNVDDQVAAGARLAVWFPAAFRKQPLQLAVRKNIRYSPVCVGGTRKIPEGIM